jgi:hypothetical protein
MRAAPANPMRLGAPAQRLLAVRSSAGKAGPAHLHPGRELLELVQGRVGTHKLEDLVEHRLGVHGELLKVNEHQAAAAQKHMGIQSDC